MSHEKTIFVQLYLGEQDGYTAEIQTENGIWPSYFYVHRNCDSGRIAEAERVHADDPDVAQLVKDALAVLCYEFTQADPKDGVTGGKQYLYTRCPDHDRAMTDPAV